MQTTIKVFRDYISKIVYVPLKKKSGIQIVSFAFTDFDFNMLVSNDDDDKIIERITEI